MLEDTGSEMLYQDATNGFEDNVELNMRLGLAPMDLKNRFDPFNGSYILAFVR